MSVDPANSTTPTDSPTAARGRVGRVVLFLGLLEFISFGVATFGVTRAAGMTVDELANITGANLTRGQLEAMHPHLKTFAGVLALCGVVPAALYVVSSAAIRRGLFLANMVAMVLAATQLFVLGAILIRQALIALGDGDPAGLSLAALLIGTPMALLVFVIRSLFQITWPRSPGAVAA